ncbi:MAG: threonylcarbamoyl-AMP synthase [Candidatus Micrarchaeota archaeon]|nr:threonylcarbamoyl-AMP synthase [Candidatus Micrarchaeota archaeon]
MQIIRLRALSPTLARYVAKTIKDGKIVVLPTETVYGIGANAFDANACRRIFRIKGRKRDNPLIVHVSSMEMAKSIGYIPRKYESAIKRAWPGPISFVVKRRAKLPSIVTAGLDTVSIRMPDNKVMLALIRYAGVPIAAPSANLSKRPSATSIRHIPKSILDKVDIIIDAGRTKHGLESTVLDLRTFTLLRPGAFTLENIRKYFGRFPKVPGAILSGKEAKRAISPGMKYRHYSPETPIFIYTGRPDKISDALSRARGKFAFVGSRQTAYRIRAMPHKDVIIGDRNRPNQIARNLFDGLIRVDGTSSDFAVSETFAEKGLGLAIMNRLRKAADGRTFRTARELERLIKSSRR